MPGDSPNATEETYAMPAPSLQRRCRFSCRLAFTTCLFMSTLLIALSVAATQPTAPTPVGGKVYVGVFKDDIIAVIDAASHRVLRTIPVPKGPHGLVMTPDGRKVYVSSDGSSWDWM